MIYRDDQIITEVEFRMGGNEVYYSTNMKEVEKIEFDGMNYEYVNIYLENKENILIHVSSTNYIKINKV